MAELFYICIYDIEGCLAKLCHKSFCHHRPDALYHTGAQVTFNTFYCSRKQGLIRRDPELLSVAGMNAPVSFYLEEFPGNNRIECAYDSYEGLFALHLHFSYGVMVLFIVICYTFYLDLEHVLRGRGVPKHDLILSEIDR